MKINLKNICVLKITFIKKQKNKKHWMSIITNKWLDKEIPDIEKNVKYIFTTLNVV